MYRRRSDLPRADRPILIVEPTYGSVDHTPVNGAIIGAISLAFPRIPLVVAASSVHYQALQDHLNIRTGISHLEIEVAPPGGIKFGRFRAQVAALVRAVRSSGSSTLIVLSSGPETFFAIRLIAMIFRSCRIFVVLHGNAGLLFSPRMRDPRYRLCDYTAAFRLCQHRRIRMIALEEHIADNINKRCRYLRRGCLAWPHPLNTPDQGSGSIPTPPRARIAFIGAISASKGFDLFLRVMREARAPEIEFDIVGWLYADFELHEIPMHHITRMPLARTEFVQRIRQVHYAFLPLRPEVYEHTASGSLVDCIAHLVPVITVRCTAVERLVRDHGPIGFVCDDAEEMVTLMRQPARLLDPQAHAAFRRALAEARARRLPAALADRIRRDLSA